MAKVTKWTGSFCGKIGPTFRRSPQANHWKPLLIDGPKKFLRTRLFGGLPVNSPSGVPKKVNFLVIKCMNLSIENQITISLAQFDFSSWFTTFWSRPSLWYILYFIEGLHWRHHRKCRPMKVPYGVLPGYWRHTVWEAHGGKILAGKCRPLCETLQGT